MNVLECVHGDPGDEASQRMDNTHTNHHDGEIKQCLPNGVILEDGAVLSDRRTRRRGKRQKNSTKLVDGKYQTLPSEKEIVEVGQVKLKDSPHGEITYVRDVAATTEEGKLTCY